LIELEERLIGGLIRGLIGRVLEFPYVFHEGPARPSKRSEGMFGRALFQSEKADTTVGIL